MECLKPGVYSLPGHIVPFFIQPEKNHCSACGQKTKSRWCSHLISAAKKMGLVFTGKEQLESLTQVKENQRAQSRKSGKKAPRPFDYKPFPGVQEPHTVHFDHENSSILAKYAKKPETKKPEPKKPAAKKPEPKRSLEKGVCNDCKECKPVDCSKCEMCLDKKKFGGQGRKKQACKNKKCGKSSEIEASLQNSKKHKLLISPPDRRMRRRHGI